MAKEITIAKERTVNPINGIKNLAETYRVKNLSLQNVEDARKEYEAYKAPWKQEYFNEQNGGYTISHKKHMFSKNKPSKEYMSGGDAEKFVGNKLAEIYGKKVEYLPENSKKKKRPDIAFDGYTWDIKYIPIANKNTIRKYIEDARKAERVVFYWDGKKNQLESLKEATKDTLKKFFKRSEVYTLPSIYYMNKNGELRNIWKNR